MKQAFIALSIMLIASCNVKTEHKSTKTVTINNKHESISFDWIIGDWIRLNEEEGAQTFEHWKKQSASTYIGLGYTLKDGDTVFLENMVLSEVAEHWQLAVEGPNEAPVIFNMTEHGKSRFRVENPDHDFPTFIDYYKVSDTLKAFVGNSEMQIVFDFMTE